MAADPDAATEPAGAPTLGDALGITAAASSVLEGDAGAQTVDFIIYRLGDLSTELTVHFSVGGDVDADDFAGLPAFSGTVAFDVGETTRTVSLTIAGDVATENDERIVVTIAAPVALASTTATTTVTTDDVAPVAFDDGFAVLADAALAGNVLAANEGAADLDADGDALVVTAVNGVRGAIGTTITLASGALLTVAVDGTFAYDPNGAFDALVPGDTATDGFTYDISDGNGGADTGTVVITVGVPAGVDLVLVGTRANESLSGGDGDDNIGGLGGQDTLDGGDGNDILRGGGSRDVLLGGDGDDRLRGRNGADMLLGGDGDDFLRGGGGRPDLLDGGAGADTMVYGQGEGEDVIVGFEQAVDLILLVGFGAPFNSFAEIQAAASQQGDDTLIDFGGGDTLRLTGVLAVSLNADDFGL